MAPIPQKYRSNFTYSKYAPRQRARQFTSRKEPLYKTVRKLIHAGETAHHKTWSEVNNLILHNTLYSLTITGNIAKGTSNGNRVGDEIFLEALKGKILFTNNSAAVVDNSETLYRVSVIRCNTSVLSASDAFSSAAVANSEVYLTTVTNSPMTALFDPKSCTVFYDEVVKFEPAITASSLTYQNKKVMVLDLYCKFKRSFVYETNSNYGKLYNYYVLISGFNASGVTGTTNIGNAYFSGDLIFKNGV